MDSAEASAMAMEAAEASKKHRRISGSDGAEEPSKRYKHHSSSSASRRDRDKEKDKDKDKDKHHHHRHHKHKHHYRRKHRAETPTDRDRDGHGSTRVSADRQHINGVPMDSEEEGRIRVARVSRVSRCFNAIGDGEEKEEGEIVEGEEYFEPMKTVVSDIESGEIHSEEAASLKNGVDEVSGPKEATCGFKMPADKEFNSRTNQEPECKEMGEELKRDLAGFAEGSGKADENAFNRAIERSCVDNGFIEKKKCSLLNGRNEEGDKFREDVDWPDEMNTKFDKNVANERAGQEAQNGSSNHHPVGHMEMTENGKKTVECA